MKHFLHGGPFSTCACGYKEDVGHVGIICLRCGQIATGPFVIRRGKLVAFVPSNNGVQPTAELAGRENVAADPTIARQPAAADA